MKPHLSLLVAAAVFGVAALAGAAEPEKERAEIRRMCQDALATLYREKPEVKAQIAGAAGYGCFSSFGVKLIFGGAGGKGLVHDHATGRDAFMNMGQVSVGVEAGIKDYREVLVFHDRKTLERFVESGWELSGGGGAAAKVKGKGGEVTQADSVQAGIDIYPMTRTGLAAGGSAAGRKYWKDKALN